MGDEMMHASVRCPWCPEEIDLAVSFLTAGPDTEGRPVVEVDDAYLRIHVATRHGR